MPIASWRRPHVCEFVQYEDLPKPLRVQFVHILLDLFGDPSHHECHTEEAFKWVHDMPRVRKVQAL